MNFKVPAPGARSFAPHGETKPTAIEGKRTVRADATSKKETENVDLAGQYDGVEGGRYFDVNRHDARLDAPENAPVKKAGAMTFRVRQFASVEEAFANLACTASGPAKVHLITTNNDKWLARWTMPSGDRTFSYFTVQQDIYGYAFLGKQLMELRQGSSVRGLVDSLANQKLGFTAPWKTAYLKTLVRHGAEIGLYNEIHKRPFVANKGYGLLAQTHDKIYAADGVGVVGGSNIGEDYFADHADHAGAWRDTDTVIHGEVVDGLWDAVDVELNSKVTTMLGKGFGRGKEVELLGAYAMMDLWLNAKPFTEQEKRDLRASEDLRTQLAGVLVDEAVARLQDPARPEHLGDMMPPTIGEYDKLLEIAEDFFRNLELRGSLAGYADRVELHDAETKILDQTSAAGTCETQIAPAFAELAAAAKESIYIENPYVCLTEDEIQVLEQAAKDGVKVIIGTNSPLSTDSAVTQAFFLRDFPMLLARIPDLEIYVSTATKLHGKSFTIDGKVTGVFTFNYDLISRYINSEVGGVHLSESLAKAMNDKFLEDLRNPKNGVLKYEIEKDAKGQPILDEHGQPTVKFGPDHHLPVKLKTLYGPQVAFWSAAAAVIPALSPMRHPNLLELRAALDREKSLARGEPPAANG